MRKLSILLPIALVGGALWLLRQQMGQLSWPAIRAALDHESPAAIAGSLALTSVSFFALGLYDRVACQIVVPDRVSAAVALLAGAAGHAVANMLGFHVVTGSAVRMRLYGRAGLRAPDILKVISLSGLALGLGILAMVVLGAVAIPLEPGSLQVARLAGGAGAALVLFSAGVWLSLRPRTLLWRGLHLPLPSARRYAAVALLGVLENLASVGALYVLLPPDLVPSFPLFVASYMAAVMLGVAGQVPGGIGVFDATVISLLAGRGRADLVAALVVYRITYTVLPFLALGTALVFVDGLLLRCRPRW